MKDSMKPCLHSLPKDVIYKEVVIIGNGPSGMVTSFMLDGNVPYLKEIPETLPIDEMLRARLSNLPTGQNLYEVDLMELAEGLEGRSQNPIPLLMDNLLRPCADLGIQAESLIEWRHDSSKRIDHVVLGRGQAGGAWHTFPPDVRTLSPGAWLTLPPHTGCCFSPERLTARAVANYCRRYVHACKLQKYFRYGVIVDSVTRNPYPSGAPCSYESCPLGANFCVSGYERSSGKRFRYVCRGVVASSGGGDRPNRLSPLPAGHSHLIHDLAVLDRACAHLAGTHEETGGRVGPMVVVVVGSGVSAADAVVLARRAGLRVLHLHRAPADALARLPPQTYPDYSQVYKMMCDGLRGDYENYTSYPNHVIVNVSPTGNETDGDRYTGDIEGEALRPKRVTVLDHRTNQTEDVTAALVGVFIGSKPDLFYLRTEHDNHLNGLTQNRFDEEQNCFLKNHWQHLKSILGHSIQICKSRYLNYTEINGNTEMKCDIKDCVRRRPDYQIVEMTDEPGCQCDGIGYGIDRKRAVDTRSNPVAIDKGTHGLLYAPKGLYAIGPLTADNFVRFIPGGALAVVSHMHRERGASP